MNYIGKSYLQLSKEEKYHISQSKTKEIKYIQVEAKSELIRLYNLMYDGCCICNKIKKEKWDDLISAIM